MSILNRPSDGSAPILLALWRGIRKIGPMRKKRLLGLCAPVSIGDEQAMKTLFRWTQLGLFLEKDDKLRLAPTFNKLETDGTVDYRAFRREVRRLTLAESSNQDFLKPEPSGAADFTFAAAWLLSTDVFADHFKDLESIQRFEQEQIAPIGEGESSYAIQNDTRWSGFRDWMAFLGLGWNASPFQLDPTEAVEDELDDIFAVQSDLTIDGFLQRLAERLPVLDGGEYFRRARKRARGSWRAIDDHEISPALTRALLRLREAGRIRFESRADAEMRQLLGVGFTNVDQVSHVELLRGSR